VLVFVVVDELLHTEAIFLLQESEYLEHLLAPMERIIRAEHFKTGTLGTAFSGRLFEIEGQIV
jgi:hypothetical protein